MSEHGEVIELMGEDGGVYLDEVYVRGHVSDAEATEALLGWLEELDEAEDYDPWEHVYARRSWEATWDGPGRVLREYRERGRGRFPVTRAKASWIRIRREERKAAEERMRVAVAEKFGDGIELLWVDATSAMFQFPAQFGTQRSVRWLRGEPDMALVPQMDHEAWRAWRDGR